MRETESTKRKSESDAADQRWGDDHDADTPMMPLFGSRRDCFDYEWLFSWWMCNPVNKKKWSFKVEQDRNEAFKVIKKMKPKFIRLEVSDGDSPEVVQFIAEMLNEQLCQGRVFALEGDFAFGTMEPSIFGKASKQKKGVDQIITPCGSIRPERRKTIIISNNSKSAWKRWE